MRPLHPTIRNMYGSECHTDTHQIGEHVAGV
jgi:hypothetical protein